MAQVAAAAEMAHETVSAAALWSSAANSMAAVKMKTVATVDAAATTAKHLALSRQGR